MKYLNKISLITVILWLGFLQLHMLSMLGKATDGPYIITWWNVIYVPFIMGYFPVLLGYTLGKERNSKCQK